MPCTYSVVTLEERERQKEAERLREQERKKREVERKKKAILIALSELGFEVSIKNLGDGKLFINGTQEEQL